MREMPVPGPLLLPLALYIGGWVICLTMLYIVPYKRDPESAAGWLIFSFFLPYLAALMFAIIGNPKLPADRRQLQRRINALITQRVETGADDPRFANVRYEAITPRYRQIAALVERLGGMPIFNGNTVDLISHYDVAIERIVADIDSAQRYVHLLYYIFADDVCGRKVVEALCRATARGVTCRVLYDGFGNRAYLGGVRTDLEAAGVNIHSVLPFRLFGKHRRRPDLRNHRKIVVIDDAVAYTGSQNLTDPTFKPTIVYEDLVARVRGPVVAQLSVVFLADWFSETNDLVPTNETPDTAPLVLPGDVPCQVLPSGPAYDTDNIPLLFAALLYTAQHRAVLTTPYFIPDASLLRAIENAALRGVDVHLIVSAQGDQFLVSRAQRSYYEEMLECGVKIHAVHEPAFIHAKHLSIDDDIAVIGSSNFDVRSFRLNLEIVLLVYSADVVAEQRKVEANYLSRADDIVLETWAQRPRWQQFIENTCRLVSALL